MKHKLVKFLFLLPVLFLSTVASTNSSELEQAISLNEAGMYIVYAEKCADNYWMEKADSETFVNALDEMIKRGISEGRVSKEKVNQAVNGAETIIAMGGFTYEQRQLCQMFTLLSRQLGKPKSRY